MDSVTKRRTLKELLASDEDSSPDNSESEDVNNTSREFDEEGDRRCHVFNFSQIPTPREQCEKENDPPSDTYSTS